MSSHSQVDILLPKFRYVLSGDQDLLLNLELLQKGEIINDNNITNFLDLASRFDEERQISKKYRIFGNLNYNSPFRHLDNEVLDSITSIKSLFDLSQTDYNDIGFKFEEYFDLRIVYPHEFQFVNDIDSDTNLYRVVYKELNPNYNVVKSGFQRNVFNQTVFNIIPNNVIDLSSLTTTVNNLYNYKRDKISIPVTELKLYIKPKPNIFKFDITLKEFNKNYNAVNMYIDSNVTYGFDDSDVDYYHYELTDNINSMILANIKRNNNTITSFSDAEFIYLFRNKILFFYKLNNIELTDNNMLLTRNIINKYIGFGFGNDGVSEGVNDGINEGLILGELIKFNVNDFTYVVEDEQEYALPFEYDYKVDKFYPQTLKETKGVIEDFINNSEYNKTSYIKKYAITYYGVDEVNKNLFVKFKCFNDNGDEITTSMSTYFGTYLSTYGTKLDTYPNKLVFNKITNGGYYGDSNEMYLTVSKNNNVNNLDTIAIKYKYNPFINVPIRYYSSSLETANDGNEASSYAYYHNGLWRWRNVLDNGEFEPDTDLGLDYPFINDTHYIDDNFILNVKVDTSDYFTNKIYSIFKSNDIGIIGYNEPTLGNNINQGVC